MVYGPSEGPHRSCSHGSRHGGRNKADKIRVDNQGMDLPPFFGRPDRLLVMSEGQILRD